MAFFGGGVGWGEIVLLFTVVLILFGPRRLPEIARQLGKTMGFLRRTVDDFKREVTQIEIDEITAEPGKTEPSGKHEPAPDKRGPESPAG